MTDAPVPDYFLEIEGHFAQRRGTPFIVSPKDWSLMKGWAEAGIPLPVVIEAIDLVFERNETSGRKKVISSLSYCRHAVKELWEDRKALAVDGGEAMPEEAPQELLTALAAAVESVSPAKAETIRGLLSEKSVPRMEERLIEIESELIAELVASLPPPEAEALHADVARAAGDTSRLDPATRARTEDANLRRIVRERFGVPRLSLF
ncbi:MAG: hypothetical protein JWO56_2743 [Acidobacteria bacterium]|nr:hypothetical protein [Acidobacteriota bacterium]